MHPELLYAYLMAIATISFGFLALTSPSTAAKLFGIEFPTPFTSSYSSQSAFIAAKGARDITIGLCYLVFGFLAEFRSVRVVTLAHAVTAAIDVFVAWRYCGENKEKRTWIYGAGTAGFVIAVMATL